MPTTLTSSAVAAAVADGGRSLLVRPGKPVCSYVSFTFNGGTVTVGQVVQMIPVPAGARILNLLVKSDWPAGTAGIFSVGDGSLTNRFVTAGASASLTAAGVITRNVGGVGYKYSVSDDVVVGSRFDTIDFSVGAGATQTTTGSIQMAVWYVYEDETQAST